MLQFFKRDRGDPFEARRPVEVELPTETAELLDDVKARYRIEITLPAEPFEVCLKRGHYLTSIEGQPASSEEADWYIQLFVDEFGLYPSLFVDKTRLKRIESCLPFDL